MAGSGDGLGVGLAGCRGVGLGVWLGVRWSCWVFRVVGLGVGSLGSFQFSVLSFEFSVFSLWFQQYEKLKCGPEV